MDKDNMFTIGVEDDGTYFIECDEGIFYCIDVNNNFFKTLKNEFKGIDGSLTFETKDDAERALEWIKSLMVMKKLSN